MVQPRKLDAERWGMIYLSGVIRPEIMDIRADLGVLLTPIGAHRCDLGRTTWAADTGCFTKPDAFVRDGYLGFLRERAHWRSTCLFATAPDVVGDPAATWARAAPVLPLIRDLGFRAALVAQDGIERMTVPWSAFDVLFLGGSTAWKLSHHAKVLTAAAIRQGKTVHMGRVNSLTRLQTAAMWGCASADGTFLAFAPTENIQRMLRWLDAIRCEPVMNFGAAP